MRALLAACFVVAIHPAQALELPLSRGGLDYAPTEPLRANPGDELILRGVVRGQAPVRAVLRLDDSASSGYGSRVNDERILPPGPFEWRTMPAGAQTTGGRLIEAQNIRRVIFFEPGRASAIELTGASLRPPDPLPAGAQGYSFGHASAPLLPGFERVAAGDPRIAEGPGIPIRRPGVDPLIASGLRAVGRLQLPWPAGRVRVSLWTEDVGEWETLPHALRRRIRVNGVDLHDAHFTPAQWVERRYLANRDAEASNGADSWETYGVRRGGLITGEVDVRDQGVRIEFAGESPVSTFVSAVLLEPAGQRAGLDEAQARRARWFRSYWRVGAPRLSTAPIIRFPATGDAVAQAIRITVAPGTGAAFAFSVRPDGQTAAHRVTITAPASSSASVQADLWAAQRRLERSDVALNLLTPASAFLRGDASALPLRAGEERAYVGWAQAPEGAPGDIYEGSILIATEGASVTVPLVVETLAVNLPAAPRPAGFYLDEAPHLTWFPGLGAERRRQLACDLRLLADLGIRGNAPALATPLRDEEDRFIVDALTAAASGVAAPWLAYAPAKRVRQQLGAAPGAARLAAAAAALRTLGMPAPLWSVADEPSNFDHSEGDLRGWISALRAADPKARLAAQLNSPKDAALLPFLDVAIVNEGFGIDVEDIRRASRGGREVWLYNTARPRLTAGYWLAATGAARYVQWHARMPTADPFDPTDGREGDVQMFFPTLQACPERPDIHIDVLAMAEGVVDQRWMEWLRTRREPAAVALLREIDGRLPRRWKDALAGEARAHEIRAAIEDLARRLN